MPSKFQIGPTQGDAAQGFDAAYDARSNADDLGEAGPRAPATGAAADDTGVKNPGGEFQHPAPAKGSGVEGWGDGKTVTRDKAGQQGGQH